MFVERGANVSGIAPPTGDIADVQTSSATEQHRVKSSSTCDAVVARGREGLRTLTVRPPFEASVNSSFCLEQGLREID